ncbi:DUF3644 domain-containing protein [Celeribacter halophilus]|jgi:hypothetical protein|uniref:DUF3644 domain-containing protein n=1 Tax=Celeribacter halophilus TaxID=576117 RepID=UPI002FCF0669
MAFFEQGRTGGLNKFEKRIVKYLISQKWSNQDILALVNLARPATVNPARIAEVKKDKTQAAASNEEFAAYESFKYSFDLSTGLNPYLDERLIKSRQAMSLAISSFNSPSASFRAEVFSILANVAWTYLILEYSDRNGLPLERQNGKAISLSDFLNSSDCPFTEGVKQNLKALIRIRDAAEHTILGPDQDAWLGIFQACCVNYENTLTSWFGSRVSLAARGTFSLQLSGLSIGQAEAMAKSGQSEKVKSINAELFDGLTEDQKNDLEFQFAVIYTTVASSKSKSKFQFLSSESAEGKELVNVLVKTKPSSETHPYRPADVCQRVKMPDGTNLPTHIHTEMWKKHKVRPSGGADNPTDTKLEFCYYNPTFGRYTYSEAWVKLLQAEVSAPTT